MVKPKRYKFPAGSTRDSERYWCVDGECWASYTPYSEPVKLDGKQDAFDWLIKNAFLVPEEEDQVPERHAVGWASSVSAWLAYRTAEAVAALKGQTHLEPEEQEWQANKMDMLRLHVKGLLKRTQHYENES